MTSWVREEVFCTLLKRLAENLTRDRVKEIVNIAVEDVRRCYKHVLAYIARQARGSGDRQRLNLLYVLAEILLATHKRLGSGNRLTKRLESEAAALLKPFGHCPQDKLGKVVGWFEKAGVFSAEGERRVKDCLNLNRTPSPNKPGQFEQRTSSVRSSQEMRVETDGANETEGAPSGKTTGEREVKADFVGPFGRPYDQTWSFGEGRDGHTEKQKLAWESTRPEDQWMHVCETIATSSLV